jgi:flagellar biosynthetic protein FliP
MGSGFLGIFAALLVTLGLLVVAVNLLKRVQAGALSGGKGIPLRLLKRVSIGPKQGVGLLQVADRVLVISIADGGIRLLTELQDPVLQEVLDDATLPQTSHHPQKWRLPSLKKILLLPAVLLLLPAQSLAQADPPASTFAETAAPGEFTARPGSLGVATFAPPIDITVGEGEEEIRLTGAVGLVVFIGFLTLLPALLLLMTSFTRILIVLQFLRPALGVQTSPPTQLLVALAIILSGVIMNPVLQESHQTALEPFFKGQITQAEAYKQGVQPFREFMLANTGERDLAVFTDLTGVADKLESIDEIPTITLVSAFVTSELRTAFQMGFVIFLPFIVVDLIVASVLMSLGMFMLPPMMVSLPFKLLLFVLADGWTLVVQNLVSSFG